LKLFSLFSLGLTASVSPLILIVESPLPETARIVLATTALATSSISTALVSWCGAPYVSTLRKLDGDNGGIEMETKTLFMNSRFTRVYDPTFLVDTKRFFAKWELAEKLASNTSPSATEETIAETRNSAGDLLGRWIVKWDKNEGHCREVGKVVRHFNVHEELLPFRLR